MKNDRVRDAALGALGQMAVALGARGDFQTVAQLGPGIIRCCTEVTAERHAARDEQGTAAALSALAAAIAVDSDAVFGANLELLLPAVEAALRVGTDTTLDPDGDARGPAFAVLGALAKAHAELLDTSTNRRRRVWYRRNDVAASVCRRVKNDDEDRSGTGGEAAAAAAAGARKMLRGGGGCRPGRCRSRGVAAIRAAPSPATVLPHVLAPWTPPLPPGPAVLHQQGVYWPSLSSSRDARVISRRMPLCLGLSVPSLPVPHRGERRRCAPQPPH